MDRPKITANNILLFLSILSVTNNINTNTRNNSATCCRATVNISVWKVNSIIKKKAEKKAILAVVCL